MNFKVSNCFCNVILDLGGWGLRGWEGDAWEFFCAHDAAATSGQYLTLSKA